MLPSASDVPRVLRSLGITLDVDRLDQHVIVDSGVIRVVVDSAGVNATDVVLEIGPGPGTITLELARRAGRVVAMEVDGRFRPLLDALPPNVDVRYVDAARAPWPRFDVLVSNPPYGLLQAIFERLFLLRPARAVLLAGSATSRSLLAAPGTSQFTRSSLIAQAAFDIEVVARVSREAFYPRPRTPSHVIRLERRIGQTSLSALATAVVREPGARVNDVLWRSGRGDLRDSLRALNVLQRRLQALSNAELSAIAAAIVGD
jgi:16S rRNA A1518/A1519 N6-dimethyltransferase RsmA/KsgA/DIM1 with predicted DNA glycosylase/AP lyase activity